MAITDAINTEGIVKSIKSAYYSLEDRYYGVLDKINKYVPVYKVVDPIDKVVPSFVLVIAAVFLLLLFLLFLSPFSPFGLFRPMPSLEAILKVTDSSNKVLEGALVTISADFLEDPIDSDTDDWGEVIVEIPGEEAEATVSVSLDGYTPVEQTVTFIADETKTIKLSPLVIVFQGGDKTVVVYNAETGRKISASVTIEFSCSNGQGNPSSQTRSDATFQVTQPGECGTLTATARANNFQSKSKMLTSDITKISLSPTAPVETTGKIMVTVKDFNGSNAADVQLTLLDSTLNAEVNTGSTSSAGTFRFEDVEPGTYKINASPQTGAATTKTDIIVIAGSTTNTTITLPETIEGKGLFIKIVDENSGNNVVDATVMFYAGSDPLDLDVTDADGELKMPISDEDADYTAVITHDNYLLKKVSGIPVSSLADDTPFEIGLTRKRVDPPRNHPIVFVKVQDEAGFSIEEALVWIYESGDLNIPLNRAPMLTNADGNYVFESLPEGTYVVFAKKEEKEGYSDPVFAEANETVVITTVIVMGEGDVEVAVIRYGTDDSISGAEIEFISVISGTVLDTCTTDSDGECVSGMISADEKVYVKASAENYLSGYGPRDLDIIGGSTASTTIELIFEGDVPDDGPDNGSGDDPRIITQFVRLCEDWECDSGIDSLESDETTISTYYAKFQLLLPTPNVTYEDIIQHIRIGPNSQISIPSSNYIARIENVRVPFGIATATTCWDSSNNFYTPTDCQDRGVFKMVNVSWDELEGHTSIPVVIEFVVEDGLQEGQEIRMYYQGQADVNTETYTTSEKLKIFSIGEVFCEDKKFAWKFRLKNLETDESFTVTTGEEDEHSIKVNSRYQLDYWIYNCHSKAWQPATLTAENPHGGSTAPLQLTDSAGIKTPGNPPFEIFSRNMSINSDINSQRGDANPIYFFTALETGESPTELNLEMTAPSLVPSEEDGREKTLNFVVGSDSELDVVGLPEKLSNIVEHPQLEGIVVDKDTGEPIEGASAKVYISGSVPVSATTPSADNGLFSFGSSIPSLSAVNTITLRIRKAGYATFNKTISVGGISFVWSPDFECISISEASEELTLRRNEPNSNKNFKVITSDCNRLVEISVESQLVLVGDSRFVLQSNDDYTLQVSPRHPLNHGYSLGLGEYPVYVRARFDRNNDGVINSFDGPFSGYLKRGRVFIKDSTSCFRLADPLDQGNAAAMKSSFNMVPGEDQGLIITKPSCYQYIEDVTLPKLVTTHLEPPMNEGAFAIETENLTRAVPDKVLMSKVYSQSGNLVQNIGGFDGYTNTLEFSVTPNGGFVNLRWVDFQMTDLQHNTGDRHRLWVERQKDGCQQNISGSTVGDCVNITGQYPRTTATRGCVDPEQTRNGGAAVNCPIISHPIISNNSDPRLDGWVDTDTYHPGNSTYSSSVSTAPIWQATHNICGNSATCNIIGLGPKHYEVKKNADKFILQVEGSNTKLARVAWEFWNYDTDHNGNTKFTLKNNSVVGENYALLKVTDTVKEAGATGPSATPFNWAVNAVGSQESTETDRALSSSRVIKDFNVLGVSADSSVSPRFKNYTYNRHLRFDSLDGFGEDSEFQSLVSDLAGASRSINNFTIRVNTSDPADLASLFVLFYTDHWEFGLNGNDLVNDDDELLNNGVFTKDILQEAGAPKDIRAYAFINDGESNADITIELLEQEIFTRTENIALGSANGSSQIEANENSKSGLFFNISIPNEADYNILYYLSTDTGGISVYFNELGEPIRTSNPDAELVAMTSTRVTQRNLGEEYVHVRLMGEEPTDCLSFGGATGATGEANMPRVKFNWHWDEIQYSEQGNEIGEVYCNADNSDYVYCDATQFTIALVKRLEEIRRIAQEEGINEASLNKIHALRQFNAYIMEDNISEDFRADLKDFLLNEALPSPRQTLLSDNHPWQEYLEQAGGYSKLVFNQTQFEAGLYAVYINFRFQSGMDYSFFHGTCGDTCDDVDLLANINVEFAKISNPVINSPFYKLPINGTVGRNLDGTYDRQGYGVGFENTNNEPLLLVGENRSDPDYLETDSDSGIKEISTKFEESMTYINSQDSTKGLLLTITKSDNPSIVFSPSTATPILLEMNSADGTAEAFYYLTHLVEGPLTEETGALTFWFGAGSSMRDGPTLCRTFGGGALPYTQPDYAAAGFANTCAMRLESGSQKAYENSFGLTYSDVENNQKVFWETVFFIPEHLKTKISLVSSCQPPNGNAVFYSPFESTAGQDLIDISKEDYHRVESVQDIIDLVKNEYVCVSNEANQVTFWWNPQKLLKELEPTKIAINSNWDRDLACKVPRAGV